MRGIIESDWKHFKKVYQISLERHCSMTLEHLSNIASDSSENPHDAYLKAYKYMMKRDKEVALVFNDYRRSTAINQLFLMLNMKILSIGDLDGFSQELVEWLHPSKKG